MIAMSLTFVTVPRHIDVVNLNFFAMKTSYIALLHFLDTKIPNPSLIQVKLLEIPK